MNKRYVNSMFLIGLFMVATEICKQFVLTNHVFNGHYNVWYVPFQLCSVPMYLCILMKFVSESLKQRMQMFLMTFTLMSGAVAFLDTTGMYYSVPLLTIHSYAWHIALIGIGIWSGIEWCKKPLTKFKTCIPVWLTCIGIATILNIILHPFGEINMFYISPFEPSQQVIVRDVVTKIGILPSNLIYLSTMLAAAFATYRVWVMIRRRFFL